MTKTVQVRFDGKTFVPDDATGVAVGTLAQIVIETQSAPPAESKSEKLIRALGGPISWEEGERLLAELNAHRATSMSDDEQK